MIKQKIKSIVLGIITISLLQAGIVVFIFTVADFWPAGGALFLPPPGTEAVISDTDTPGHPDGLSRPWPQRSRHAIAQPLPPSEPGFIDDTHTPESGKRPRGSCGAAGNRPGRLRPAGVER